MIFVMTGRPAPTPIGTRLRELRGDRTQDDIARAVGVKAASVSLWEHTGKVSRKHAAAYDNALGAGGEVMNLLGYTDTTVSVTTIDAKIDLLLELVRKLADSPRGSRRRERDETPREMPRPALRRDR